MVDLPFKQIRNRFITFFILFILISGTVGSWVVTSGLLEAAHFWIYGNIGKLVLLLLLFLALQVRGKIKDIEVLPRTKLDNFLIILSLGFVPIFLVATDTLIYQDSLSLSLIVLSHLCILLSGSLLFIGVFGFHTIWRFTEKCASEVKICLALLPFLYIGIFQIWKLWPFFSTGVLQAVNVLLSFTFKTRVIPPYTLFVNTFGIQVAEACSGLDSLFMFSMLYLLMIVSEWKVIEKKLALLAYIPLAIGLYSLNIFRVYLLVLIGALWSPEIAVHLFHTYAAMVLFFAYFLAFFKWWYPKLKKRKAPASAIMSKK